MAKYGPDCIHCNTPETTNDVNVIDGSTLRQNCHASMRYLCNRLLQLSRNNVFVVSIFLVMAFGKLLTPVCFCHQAV